MYGRLNAIICIVMELSIMAVERGTLTESDDSYYNCRHTCHIDIA